MLVELKLPIGIAIENDQPTVYVLKNGAHRHDLRSEYSPTLLNIDDMSETLC